jgi:hypothetical protein
MGLCETVLANISLDCKFMSVNGTFAIPTSEFLKDEVAFVFGVNLLSGTSTATSWPSRSTECNPCHERCSRRVKINNVKYLNYIERYK